MIIKVTITLLYNWDVYQHRIKQVTAIAVRDSRSFLSLNLRVVTLVRDLLSCVNGRNYIWEFRGPQSRTQQDFRLKYHCWSSVEAKEKDQVDAILKILVGAEPENLFSSILIGAKAKPLKQPKVQHKEYDETDLANLRKKKRETLC
ncbi:uncharacterized protein LOC113297622 [Papaver somniferum]|uniref:uncharacterized protein LOC113297622 n=1 Tax=Papaver somniferum TaxID=3469 RepID=UPI000E6FC962|nr:uncharacterized protein LOC113297622 [Papaver somniferum]XP_026401937.1 uncharacterized protein LOC113297622 [Papaver somniferum]XP_026401938.1 uncharacterized protein LOC113297622 [Papaver somniferum]XP_026401939.1 uncharacterized protein LOC113297622 [Papaver somniferum]XP_026401940.1 uncharacterized protein LOC113297622 [Papaver somniferum]